MGNQPSAELQEETPRKISISDKEKYKSFPGSAILEKTFCGSIDTTDPAEYEDVTLANRLLKKADIMCISSPEEKEEFFGRAAIDMDQPKNKASAMLARALVSEVTDNPKTMKQSEMAAREKQLLKAQQAAHSRRSNKDMVEDESRPVGAPGGVGAPSVLSSLAFAVTGDETAGNACVNPAAGATTNGGMMGPGSLQDGRGYGELEEDMVPLGPYAVTIGLSLSRRHSGVGHPETVTRQTAFDFNELQDRSYKYVSSTDPSGWRAGGGERGGPPAAIDESGFDDGPHSPKGQKAPNHEKIPSPDVVHIPIIHINCESEGHVEQVIHSLASGEIFIPHMAVLPESLSVNGISPPDLVVRFDCERNDDAPPDEWPNWCLEFMHNQLYEYFYSLGARWMKRPFSITMARKVKWKTVKHMNRYFANAKQVIEGWKERGPQLLDPQLSYVEGGATPEEVAHPHGIYLMRNGMATNYFAPNFDPPYTTKMTRSLLENVMNKSWDRKRQEWSSEAIPKLVTPNMLLAMACGCTDPTAEGFMAREVTANTIRKTIQDGAALSPRKHASGLGTPQSVDEKHNPRSTAPQQRHQQAAPKQQQQQQQHHRHAPQERKPERQEEFSPGQSSRITEPEEPQDYKSSGQTLNQLPSASDEQRDSSNVPKVETVTSEAASEMDGNRGSGSSEEKKTDEASEKSIGAKSSRSSRSSRSKPKTKSSSWKSENQTSSTNPMVMSGEFGTSDFPASMALSGTTVMHANVTKGQQRFSEDDWAQPIKPEEGADAQQSRWTKKKKDKQSPKELLDQERKRQEQLLQKVQSGESAGSRKGKSSHYKMTPVTPISPNKRGGGGTDFDVAESAISMEYSQDGSSAYMTEGGSTLFGQQFANDSPSMTKASTKLAASTTEEDENSAFMSVQASSASTMSVVPTDDELLAIGWAKAMDATSGNYYYYTLDRSKIVWDNPLSSNNSVDEGNSSRGTGVDP